MHADAFGDRAVESLDVFEPPQPGLLFAFTVVEEFGKRVVRRAAVHAGHHAPGAGEEIIAGLELAIDLNPLRTGELAEFEIGGACGFEDVAREAVDKLGAEFDRHALGRVDGPDAPADAVARFEQENTQSRFAQQPGGRKTGHTRANDDDIRRFRCHGD